MDQKTIERLCALTPVVENGVCILESVKDEKGEQLMLTVPPGTAADMVKLTVKHPEIKAILGGDDVDPKAAAACLGEDALADLIAGNQGAWGNQQFIDWVMKWHPEDRMEYLTVWCQKTFAKGLKSFFERVARLLRSLGESSPTETTQENEQSDDEKTSGAETLSSSSSASQTKSPPTDSTVGPSALAA